MAEGSLARQQYWQHHIARYLRGDLSRREYCEQHNLKPSTFDYWRRRVRPEDIDECAPMVNVMRVELEPIVRPAFPPVEILLENGRCIRVAKDFDADTLVRVVRTLEGLS